MIGCCERKFGDAHHRQGLTREGCRVGRNRVLWWNNNMSASNGNYRWLDDDGPAFGCPGLPPRWTSSEKDAVSTAYAASTKIWFTASHGTLNEIYFPTIDRPQTRDMELLFTDEETFFHEEKRDIAYDFQYIDENALAIRVTGHDVSGRYTVVKEFITDPHGGRGGAVTAEVLCVAGAAPGWGRCRELGAVAGYGRKPVFAGVEE
jgi:hypothetical protein